MSQTTAVSKATTTTTTEEEFKLRVIERQEGYLSKEVNVRVRTTDGTPVEPYAYPVKEASAIIITGEAVAIREDGSDYYSADFKCTFSRETGGNVTKRSQSEIVNQNKSISGNFGIAFNANTTDQTAELVVDPPTGILIWSINLKILEI